MTNEHGELCCPSCNTPWTKHMGIINICKAYKNLELLVKDHCGAEIYIQNKCKEVLPADFVDGDNYGVPAIEDLVDKLVEEIKRLKSLH